LEIDQEINRFIDEGHSTAMKILTENKEKLEFLARTLIEKETLDGKELEKIFNEIALPASKRKVKKTKIPALIKPEAEAERVPQPKKAPAMPRLIPKQTPAAPD